MIARSGKAQVWNACNLGATSAWTGGLAIANCYGTESDCNSRIRFTLGAYFRWGRNGEVASLRIADRASTGSSTDGEMDGNLWGGRATAVDRGTFMDLSRDDKLLMRGPCAAGYHVPTQKEWCEGLVLVSPTSSGGTPMPCGGIWHEEGVRNAFRDALRIPLAGVRDGKAFHLQ